MRRAHRRAAGCLSLLLLLCALTLCAAGCKKDDGAPQGYRLASDPARDGCYLYIPDAWQSNRASGPLMAYASNLNTANVSLVYLTPEAESISAYWAANEAEFARRYDAGSYRLGTTESVQIDGKDAFLYTYDAAYTGVGYRFLQYLIPMGNTPSEGLYILTCTASVAENISGGTDFEDHYENFRGIAENLRFAGNRPDTTESDLSTPSDSDPAGMKLAADKRFLGVRLYVPDAWRVALTGGFVAAVPGDGTGIAVSEVDYATAYARFTDGTFDLTLRDEGSGFTLLDYLELLRAEYATLLTDLTVTVDPVITREDGTVTAEPLMLGESVAYRMSLTGLDGERQVAVTVYLFRSTRTSRSRFYSLVYTASPDVHDAHIAEIESILTEVTY